MPHEVPQHERIDLPSPLRSKRMPKLVNRQTLAAFLQAGGVFLEELVRTGIGEPALPGREQGSLPETAPLAQVATDQLGGSVSDVSDPLAVLPSR